MKRKPSDANQTAFRVVQQVTGESSPPDDGKDPAAVSLGRRGGLKGGPARAESLTAKRRAEIAKKAANKRWKGHKKGERKPT